MALDCTICMDPLGEFLSVLKCGHKFHSKCIIEYGVKHNNKELTCPLCRDKILTNDSVTIVVQQDNHNIITDIDHRRLLLSKCGIGAFVGCCLFIALIFMNPASS